MSPAMHEANGRGSLPKAAQCYLELGLCALPACRRTKRPAIGAWKRFQSELPAVNAWQSWPASADAICVLTGEVSGNLELIDFDFEAELFEAWRRLVSIAAPRLLERLVIEQSQSGGCHVFYRCAEAEIQGNQKLAQRRLAAADGNEFAHRGKTVKPRRVNGNWVAEVCLIETRGEGGLVLCAPSPGYRFTQLGFDDLPIVTVEERQLLLDAARTLNEVHEVHWPPSAKRNGAGNEQANRPGDDYNERGDFRTVLESGGWAHVRTVGENELWRRPGKTGFTWSASLRGKQFYVHSSNAAPFAQGTCYTPFAIYALLEHNGDYGAAAGKLRELGFGNETNGRERAYGESEFSSRSDEYVEGQLLPDTDVTVTFGDEPGGLDATSELSGSVKYHRPPEHKSRYANQVKFASEILRQARSNLPPEDIDGYITNYCEQRLVYAEGEGPKSLGDFMTRYKEQRSPIIHGLLREGETMNVIAAPKIGKSWLIYSLALSIVTGRRWLDTFDTVQGDVLLIDNELYPETLATRIPIVANAMKLEYSAYAGHFHIEPLRGHLRDINSMNGFFARLQRGRYKLVIIDAWYRALPKETDENANGDMTSLYNQIDAYAQRLRCAFALVHHASKGSQSGKSVTDVGAGAGAQSRAADTHLVLRPHEEDNVVVLDAVVRSWPSVDPICLRWQWPTCEVETNLDPTTLRKEGRRDSKGRKPPSTQEWTGEEFAKAFGTAEPKERAAIVDTAIKEGLSDRKANELFKRAKAVGALHEWPDRCFATVAPPVEIAGNDAGNAPGTSATGLGFFKRDRVEQALRENPTASDSEIGRTLEVDRTYVGRIRRELKATA